MKKDWTYKKLGEVCEVLDSQRKPVTKRDRKEGIYPYYGASGVQDFVDSYIFDGRYLLVGEDGAKWGPSDKSAYIIEGKCWVNNHAHILKVSDEIIDRLLEYYLVFEDLNMFITGAIVPKLTQKALVNIDIPVPPMNEQQQIVAELDLLSGMIDKQKAQIDELDKLSQSIFYDMFGDPVTNDKGWVVSKYGEKFKISSGGTPSKTNPEYWDNGNIPWIGSNMCQNCVIYDNDGKYITEKGLYSSSTNILKVGTVLIALVGATIGKVALLQKEMATNQNIANINVWDSKEFNSMFIFFHSMNLYHLFMNLGDGGFKMANQGFIRELPLICPPLSTARICSED